MHLSTLPSYHHHITIGCLQSAESQVSPQLAKWPALCTHSTTALSAHAAAFQEQPLCRKVIERKPLHSKSLA